MSKDSWIEAREKIVMNRIEEFFDKYGRDPTSEEEYKLEMDITEDEMRDSVASSYQDDEYDR